MANPMLIDLSLKNSSVLVIGAGRVGMRKAKSALGESSKVTLVSDRFTAEAKKLERAGVRLVKADVRNSRVRRRILSSADLVIAATNDYQLNRRIANAARSMDVMIGSVDDPSDSDFNFPAVRTVGGITVGVATGGRSPAMARLICKKLVNSITREDRLKVELMDYVRSSAKSRLPTPAARRAAIYQVLGDGRVGELLKIGRLSEAKSAAEAIVEGK